MNKKVVIVAAAIYAAAFDCHAEGINTLVEVAASMGEAKKVLDKETANFNSVKTAIDSGRLSKGQPKGQIRAQYGEPVVENKDIPSGRERWVYKSADSSFFKGVRIYLFFDDKGMLEEIKILE
ncbi:MAG: hypothetical protein NC938_06635 [Candidatus Omnitrophica bacterium]|nr:hypothetical protein [Candidatus Omnitrophota bacterium]MCM8791353.1 hypothetical protein [Candidatus Omnitrophota bacterium]